MMRTKLTIEQINDALELMARPPWNTVIIGYVNDRITSLTDMICESEENAERNRGARLEAKKMLNLRDFLLAERERLRKEVEIGK